MGTQQILLIVLSVIIVGIAVAVGITMFQQNASNQNRQAIIADMNNFAASATAFAKTPESHGGGNGDFNTIDEVGQWIGYGFDTSADSIGTDNGSYILSFSGADSLIITGTGTETGNNGTSNVEAVLGVNPQGDISTTINN